MGDDCYCNFDIFRASLGLHCLASFANRATYICGSSGYLLFVYAAQTQQFLIEPWSHMLSKRDCIVLLSLFALGGILGFLVASGIGSYEAHNMTEYIEPGKKIRYPHKRLPMS